MAERDEEWMIELAAATVDHGADRIERVYSWEVERLLAVVRAALAVAGSIIAVINAAVFEEVGRVGARHARLRRLYGKYIESLRLFAVVERPEETDRWIP